MICYRDQSYCRSDCINQACFRLLTDEVKQKAHEVGLPIATCDFSQERKDYQPGKKDD